VLSVAFFPDAHTLAIGRSDGSVELRDLADPARAGPASRLVPPAGQSGAGGVVFAGQRGLLAFQGAGGTAVTVMDFREPTRGGHIVKPFFPGRGGEGVPRVLGFSPDGRILAVGVSSWGSYVTLWDVSDPVHPRAWARH
jgi:WD40 repeat protein